MKTDKRKKPEVGFFFAQEDGGDWLGPFTSAEQASEKFRDRYLKDGRSDKTIVHIYNCVNKLEISVARQIQIKDLP